AGRAADADAVREAGVHAHVPEGIGAVGVLRAELSAGESPVVDAHLVRTGAAETRALADARTTACKRAILPADARAGALRIGRARRADAVARVAAVVATRVTVGAIGGDAERRRRQVIATPAAAVAAATGGADGGRRVRRCRGDRRARPAVAGIRARVLVEAAQASVPALPQGLRLGNEEARRLL